LCGCEATAERFLLDVVRANALAVDLDDGNPLPVARLELGIAVDRDLLELEAELVAERRHLRARPVAERAAGRVIDDDARARHFS
jgi:hypothetical protein